MSTTLRDFLILPTFAGTVQAVSGAKALPNVVLIFCGDLGYGILAVVGAKCALRAWLQREYDLHIFTMRILYSPRVATPARVGGSRGAVPTRSTKVIESKSRFGDTHATLHG